MFTVHFNPSFFFISETIRQMSLPEVLHLPSCGGIWYYILNQAE